MSPGALCSRVCREPPGPLDSGPSLANPLGPSLIAVNRRGLGVARGSHRESPKEQGMCQALSTPEFPRTSLVSSRGEEGPCEYLIIRPGSENFMSHMPAGTVCPASYVTAGLWAGQSPGGPAGKGPALSSQDQGQLD